MKDSIYMLLLANIYFATSNESPQINRFIGLGFFVCSIMYMVGGQ